MMEDNPNFLQKLERLKKLILGLEKKPENQDKIESFIKRKFPSHQEVDKVFVWFLMKFHPSSDYRVAEIKLRPDDKKFLIELLFTSFLDGIENRHVLTALANAIENGTGTPEFILQDNPNAIDWRLLHEVFNELEPDGKAFIFSRLKENIDETVIGFVQRNFKLEDSKLNSLFSTIKVEDEFIKTYSYYHTRIDKVWKDCFKDFSTDKFDELNTRIALFRNSLNDRSIIEMFQYLKISRDEAKKGYYPEAHSEMYLQILFKITGLALIQFPYYSKNRIAALDERDENILIKSFYGTTAGFSNVLAYYRGSLDKRDETEDQMKVFRQCFLMHNLLGGYPQYLNQVNIIQTRVANRSAEHIARIGSRAIGNRAVDSFSMKLGQKFGHERKVKEWKLISEDPLKIELVDKYIERNTFVIIDIIRENGTIVYYIEHSMMPSYYFRTTAGYIQNRVEDSIYQMVKVNTEGILIGVAYLMTILGYTISITTGGLGALIVDATSDFIIDKALDAAGIKNPALAAGIGILAGVGTANLTGKTRKFNDMGLGPATTPKTNLNDILTNFNAQPKGKSLLDDTNKGVPNPVVDAASRMLDDTEKAILDAPIPQITKNLVPESIVARIGEVAGVGVPWDKLLKVGKAKPTKAMQEKLKKLIDELRENVSYLTRSESVDYNKRVVEIIENFNKSPTKKNLKMTYEELFKMRNEVNAKVGEIVAQRAAEFSHPNPLTLFYKGKRGESDNAVPIFDFCFIDKITGRIVIVEAKGGRYTKLGKSIRRVYNADGSVYQTRRGEVKQGSPEWLFQRIMEVSLKDMKAAKKLFQAAKTGNISMIVMNTYHGAPYNPKDLTDEIIHFFKDKKYLKYTHNFDPDEFFK